MQGRGYTKYLNLNANLFKTTNKCKINQLNNERDYYFAFGDNNFLRPLFWTNNVTEVLIQQYNPYTSEAALLSALNATSALFGNPCLNFPNYNVPPPMMASPSSYTILYPGNIPSQINNFPWGWMRISASSDLSVEFADIVRSTRRTGSRVMFIDRNNGFSQYAATTVANPPSPPFLGLRNGQSISLGGYTVVQIQLWYDGTPNAINTMSTQCEPTLNLRYTITSRIYQGCTGGLFILPNGGPSQSSWDGLATTTPIDTWIDMSFQTFYYLSRSNNTNPFFAPF